LEGEIIDANLLVVAAYLLGVLALGVYLARYVRRDEDFFLAGRALNHWVVAGTIMATNVAAIYLVGPAGAAYGSGVPALLIAWTGNMIAAVSAILFVPRLRRLRITTISEMLEERYSVHLRVLVAVVWMIYYALFAGNAIYTLSASLRPVLDVSINTIIWFVGAGVILYCFASGLLAVVYTDVLQTFLIILGGVVLLPVAMKAVGGLGEFTRTVPENYFVFWKAGETWPTYKDVIMFTIIGLPYWCTSQYMLQRSFAGRTVRDASKGLILAALLTGPITLTYILPGICGSLLYSGDTALGKPDLVLSTLFADLLPVGLGGLFIAALVAASNSTASSLLNSLATLFEHDIFRRFTSARRSSVYTWVGRGATLVGGALGLIFAFSVEGLGGIIQANYEIMTFFEIPIFIIVAAGLFSRWANAPGAVAAVVVGVGYNVLASFAWGMGPADRTFRCFPLSFAALLVFSVLWRLFFPGYGNVEHSPGPPAAKIPSFQWQGRRWLGLGIAALGLFLFVACAFGEEGLPKPLNILIFMGLMTTFVLGIYIALPTFVEKEEVPETVERGGIETSWINRIAGSPYAWGTVYALAAILMIVLYLVSPTR
jgi:SSS family solute:Na+ symporter